MHKVTTMLIGCGFALLPLAANAYIGPGAGLSLLGALWALITAIATAVFFVIAWPVRRMRRRKREAKEREAEEREASRRSASGPDQDARPSAPDAGTLPPSRAPHRSQRQ